MNKPVLQHHIESAKWVGPDDLGSSESGLVHCIRMPPLASWKQPVPVIVMLHGWGGDESVMWIFKKTVPAGVAAITPRAPITLDEGQFIWFTHVGQKLRPAPDTFEQALTKLHRFLTSLPRLYPVDLSRLVLIGFSQGAAIGNAYAIKFPGSLVGIASLAGAIPHLPDLNFQTGSLTGLEVFIAHGIRDEILPLTVAHRSREIYADLGATVTYGEYSTAHKMNPQAMKDLKIWLNNVFSE
jgi:phospholipase/carboxylesterase